MTPEQKEQWRQAIHVVDYMDFHALSEKGLQEFDAHLASWGVPSLMQLRGHCIRLGWATHEIWVPDFALRSETALIGLQICYPTSEAQVMVYRRVLLRFFSEALNPIVVWAREGDEKRRNGYEAVVRVQELCQRLLQTTDSFSSTEHLAWSQTLKEALDPESHLYRNEIYSSLDLAILMLTDWQHIVFSPEHWQIWWRQLAQNKVSILTRHLHGHHRRRLEEKNTDFVSYEPIATAFLAALEAECPSPD